MLRQREAKKETCHEGCSEPIKEVQSPRVKERSLEKRGYGDVLISVREKAVGAEGVATEVGTCVLERA